jgi:hypothetical protein
VGARGHFADGVVRDTPSTYVGYIIYTADGHMAFLRMKAHLPGFAGGNIEDGTVDEKLAAYDNFVAYSGTYTLRDDHTVVHHVELSSFPNMVGEAIVRTFEVDGDILTVTTLGPSDTGSGGQCSRRRWANDSGR